MRILTPAAIQGRARIMWDDPGGNWTDYGYTLNLTDTPSGQVVGSHAYSSPGTYTIDYAVYDNVISWPIFLYNTPMTTP